MKVSALRRTVVLLACLALAAVPAMSSRTLLADSTDVTITLSGKAIVISTDRQGERPQRLLGVRTPDGQRVLVQLANAAQAAGLHSGMHLELTGHFQQAQQQQQRGGVSAAAAAAGGNAATHRHFAATSLRASGGMAATPRLDALSSGSVVATAAGRATAATALSSNQLVAKDVSTLFIPIAAVRGGKACPGTAQPKFTIPEVKKAVFQEVNPSGVTVGSTYNKCSYGESKLTTNNSAVAPLVELPCSGTNYGVSWSFSKCDFDDYNGYSDAADAWMRKRGVNVDAYKHKVYLLPPSACAFVGLGYVGCDGSFECRSWIGADFWATPAAMAHELGHNLFMGHAGAMNGGTFDEYADMSGMMGYCCSDRCPNTPHAWQQGWISVQQLDGTSLKPGRTLTTTISSQSRSFRSGLRIVPDWAPKVAPVFLGFRTKAGGDAATTDMARKLHIYSANITNSFDPQVTTWEAEMGAAGAAWSHPAARLVVRLHSIAPGAATVSVCRKAGSETLASCQAGLDNDCDGLTGARDAMCSRLFKRAAGAVKQPPPARPKLRRASLAKPKQ